MDRPSPSEFLRQRLIDRVRRVLNDVEKGQKPIQPSDDAYHPPNTPIRLVHADLVGMMVGGIRGLLIQMLHPHALQGVLDHSDFRKDAHGRLRRTARFIAVTTFGHRDEADKAINRVNAIHRRITGILPDGSEYSAQDPRTLAFVHVAEATSFLAGYMRYVRPDMPIAEQDEYYRQFADVARKLHADPVPETRAEADRLMLEMRGDLKGTQAAREVAQFVLNQNPEGTPPGMQKLIGAAAIDLLPPYARQELGLRQPGLLNIPAQIVTQTAGSALRWAFRQ